jgi:CheY-like chemotaxis protein
MLVDDSFDTRRYMRSIFAPFCKLVEARDGKEALDLCEVSMPDLIVSDVMMPVVSGKHHVHWAYRLLFSLMATEC